MELAVTISVPFLTAGRQSRTSCSAISPGICSFLPEFATLYLAILHLTTDRVAAAYHCVMGDDWGSHIRSECHAEALN